jgi:hypothetical protein
MATKKPIEEQQPPAAEETPTPPEPAVWKSVAFARTACTIAYSFGLVRYVGGDVEEEPSRVEVLRACSGFDVVDVSSPEHLAQMRADLAAEVDDLRARAERIGYTLVRHTEKAR